MKQSNTPHRGIIGEILSFVVTGILWALLTIVAGAVWVLVAGTDMAVGNGNWQEHRDMFMGWILRYADWFRRRVTGIWGMIRAKRDKTRENVLHTVAILGDNSLAARDRIMAAPLDGVRALGLSIYSAYRFSLIADNGTMPKEAATVAAYAHQYRYQYDWVLSYFESYDTEQHRGHILEMLATYGVDAHEKAAFAKRGVVMRTKADKLKRMDKYEVVAYGAMLCVEEELEHIGQLGVPFEYYKAYRREMDRFLRDYFHFPHEIYPEGDLSHPRIPTVAETVETGEHWGKDPLPMPDLTKLSPGEEEREAAISEWIHNQTY